MNAVQEVAIGKNRFSTKSEQKEHFEKSGFLVLPAFFSIERVESLKRHINDLWNSRTSDCPIVIDLLDNRGNPQRTLFQSVNLEDRRTPYKLLDLHLVDPVVQDLSADPDLLNVLHGLLDAKPVVCNTLLFERGSQQPAHFDTFFMPSATLNKMCATWIAVDSVTETNGPLFYYPGSHLIEPYRFSHGRLDAVAEEMPLANKHVQEILAEYKLEKVHFMPQPGDVLIWHAQLLHGGSPITNMDETRTSLVTHYWTTLDINSPADRLDLGDGRLLLRREHQAVFTVCNRATVDAFVSRLRPTAAELSALPPEFDARAYLLKNSDIFHAGANPYQHYLKHGRSEGRTW